MIFDKNTDPVLRDNMISTYEEIKKRCEKQIEEINYKCAFGGESMSEHKDRFEALKESLRHAKDVLKKARLIEG
jgi:hypothetical protein